MTRKGILVVFSICIITGFFLTVAVRTHLAAEERKSADDMTVQLVNQVTELENQNTEIESEIKGIRSVLTESQKTDSQQASTLNELQQNLEQSMIKAGLEDLQGPGITVSLDDRTTEAQAAYKLGRSTSPYLIHYSRLVNIVNDMRIAGAEAIAINGVRVITSTDIKCAGDVILVNTTRLSPPYVITAIGNVTAMKNQLMTGDYYILQSTNFPVSITESDNIMINGYRGSISFNYAQPASDEEIASLE